MKDIVQIVINRLKQRETRTFTVSASINSAQKLTNQPFLKNKYLHITDCDSFFLKRFIEKNEQDTMIKWLFKSFDFGCKLKFQCSFSDASLIPKELFQYDIEICTANNQPCYRYSEKFITYEQVAILPDKAVLISSTQQKFTWLAAEQVKKKQITIFRRSDSLC